MIGDNSLTCLIRIFRGFASIYRATSAIRGAMHSRRPLCQKVCTARCTRTLHHLGCVRKRHSAALYHTNILYRYTIPCQSIVYVVRITDWCMVQCIRVTFPNAVLHWCKQSCSYWRPTARRSWYFSAENSVGVSTPRGASVFRALCVFILDEIGIYLDTHS